MITENVLALQIHKLTQEQYNREFENGNLDETALYLTPEVERIGDLANLKTNVKTSIVDAINELYVMINSLNS